MSSELENIEATLNSNKDGDHKYIFSPYIKKRALKSLLDKINSENLVIITRWRINDLISGASDIEIFPLLRDNDIELRLHPRIHLKVYSWDLETAIVGSANVTGRGLGLVDEPNEEYLVSTKVSKQRRIQLQRILNESTKVTDELYEETKSKIDQYDKDDVSITEELKEVPIIPEKMLVKELPMTASPSKLVKKLSRWEVGWENLDKNTKDSAYHDITIFCLDKLEKPMDELVLSDISCEFFKNEFIKEIDSQVDPEIYFGELTAWIHDNCEDVPVPSRKEVKDKVSNLLKWFTELNPETYEVDVPKKRSQRLRKKI